MSSHPTPGNRTQYINQEAQTLTIASAADTSGFDPVKTAFASLPPAKSMGELGKPKGEAKSAAGNGESVQVGVPGQPVTRPSTQYRTVSGGKVFQASVPSEWTSLTSASAIKVVPTNGYGQLNGQTVFTYGIEFGVTKAVSRNLQEATDAWLNAVAQGNPNLKPAGPQEQTRISQRTALATALVNQSPLGGQELIVVYTTFLAEGSMFYYLTIVPENDAEAYQETFQRIGESIRLTEVR
jgi:hypothetical protein